MNVNLQPSRPNHEDLLAEHIREALKLADVLRNHSVGILLDSALVRLTGVGIVPDEIER